MKRFILSLFISIAGFFTAFGMSFSEAQEHAYYLTDKMAYELDLTPEQYDQVYQVNLEYLLNVRSSNPFNYYWDYRNTDLSYILFDWQYSLYRATDYFFRPIVRRNRAWYFPLWERYHRTYYYYSRPTIYSTWHGGIWVGRTHHTPSPYYGHRPPTHIGGMAGHGGHYNHSIGHPVNHGNGGYNHNNGGNHNHNNGGYNHNNGGNRPSGNGGVNNNNNNGGNRPSGNGGVNHNNGGNRPSGNGGVNHNNGGNRPSGNGGVNSGNRGGSRGGSATPSRGGSSTPTRTSSSTPTRTNSSSVTRSSSSTPSRSTSATSGSRGGSNSAGSRSFGGGRR